SLKDSAHSFYAAKQLARKARIPKKMIVEKVKMTAGKTSYFRQRIIDKLRVETATPGEEGIFVTEGAVVRAASRNDDRVRHQVSMPLNQIPAYWRQTVQCPH